MVFARPLPGHDLAVLRGAACGPPGLRLDEKVKATMDKLRPIAAILKGPPEIDHRSFRSPTCLASAEDLARGLVFEDGGLSLFRPKRGRKEPF